MNIDTLIKYCTKGKVYGWTLSWYGLKKYEDLEKRGLIKLWSLRGNTNERYNKI